MRKSIYLNLAFIILIICVFLNSLSKKLSWKQQDFFSFTTFDRVSFLSRPLYDAKIIYVNYSIVLFSLLYNYNIHIQDNTDLYLR